jgi:DMSO/TMAO reductase YedYZ molybdopterin-dependent catalytic subunit
VDLKTWDFKVWGEVENPFELSWAEFKRLPRKSLHTDIHCVTRWSRLDMDFEGVPIQVILERAKLRPTARFVVVHAEQGYTTNLSLDDLMRPENLLADTRNGEPISPEHGWPLRLFVPHLYFWKSAKWVRGFEFLSRDRPGFWESYGYHNHGDPWREERYG